MIKIKLANNQDINFIITVCRSVELIYNKIMPGSFERQALKFEKEGLPTNYEISIVYYEECPIGFIGLKTLNEETVYLVALYLMIDFQRQGYGKKIINDLIRLQKVRGIRKVVLLVHKEAIWAINFYSKNDFIILADNEEDIKNYKNGILEKYALSNTLLLKKEIE